MITRKRGRIEPKCLDAMSTSASQECEIPDNRSSPESDTNDWGLDDLLTSDFNWELEDNVLSPFPDLRMQDLGDGADSVEQASVVTVSQSRGSRQKMQDLSAHVNKNALAARMNRLKKKEYLNSLEHSVGSLTNENRLLKQENVCLTKRVEELENETRYLRAVLANESMLAQLLSRLSGVNGMKFSTSLFQESSENDHDYAIPRKRVKVDEKGGAGGVCLHVDKDHVSVEFCTKCAESASASLKM